MSVDRVGVELVAILYTVQGNSEQASHLKLRFDSPKSQFLHTDQGNSERERT